MPAKPEPDGAVYPVLKGFPIEITSHCPLCNKEAIHFGVVKAEWKGDSNNLCTTTITYEGIHICLAFNNPF